MYWLTVAYVDLFSHNGNNPKTMASTLIRKKLQMLGLLNP